MEGESGEQVGDECDIISRVIYASFDGFRRAASVNWILSLKPVIFVC